MTEISNKVSSANSFTEKLISEEEMRERPIESSSLKI